MTSRVEQVSNVTCASDMISKIENDATVGQACSQNKAYYRISRTGPAGSITYSRLIPFKPPCVYMLIVTWNLQSTTTPSKGITYYALYQFNQVVSGAAISMTGPNDLINAQSPNPGYAIDFAKNASSDSLDLTINSTVATGTVTENIEVEVVSNKNF